MDLREMLDNLNPEQLAVATHPGGPLLVLAGAGSGKTRVLVARIATLLERGVAPWRVLAITFTNKAAGEMKERVERLIGPRGHDVWVSTFHAACVRLLRRDIEKLGYDRRFAILDAADQAAVVKAVLKQLNMGEKQYPPGAMLAAISAAKNELLSPAEFQSRATDYIALRQAEVYKAYQERMVAGNALDFDDLILNAVRLLQEFPLVRGYYQEKFQHILVDEFQDTNQAQYTLVKLLAGVHRNLTVVGDDDQSIYGWRGATIRNILEFEQDWPDATVIKLEQNYRSTQNILDAAYAVVCCNVGRKDKRIWTAVGTGEPLVRFQARDEHDEAWFVAGEIAARVEAGQRYSDFAVLYRSHAQSRALEEALVLKRIPYGIVGGVKFFERREVKDVLSYLRLISNPADLVSFRRAVQVPKRGIGPATVDRLEEAALALGRPILAVARSAGELAGIGKAHSTKVATFCALLDTLRAQAEFLPVAELIDEVTHRSGLLAELQANNTLEDMGRIENLQELKSVAMESEALAPDPDVPAMSPLELFLSQVALVAEADRFAEGDDKVVLMTLHSAKGLEFPVVFIVGMEEGLFPSSRSELEERLDEERRLCYVGMTRARQRLFMTHASTRMLYGNLSYNQPSRFLAEVPSQLVNVEGAVSAPATGSSGQPEDFSPAIGSPGWGARTGWSARRTAQATTSAVPVSGEMPSFSVGESVLHAKFGPGTVREQKGDLVTVHFPEAGEKTLVANYLQRKAP